MSRLKDKYLRNALIESVRRMLVQIDAIGDGKLRKEIDEHLTAIYKLIKE